MCDEHITELYLWILIVLCHSYTAAIYTGSCNIWLLCVNSNENWVEPEWRLPVPNASRSLCICPDKEQIMSE